MFDALGKVLAWPLLALVWLYRKLVSPMLGANCRFEPSCSAYAETALRRHPIQDEVTVSVDRPVVEQPNPRGGHRSRSHTSFYGQAPSAEAPVAPSAPRHPAHPGTQRS